MKAIGFAFSMLAAVSAYAASPLALGDKYSTKINNVLAVSAPGVRQNDQGVSTVSLATGPSHGKVNLAANGGFTYTPFADYVGPDSFTYTAESGIYKTSAAVTIDVRSTLRAAVSGAGVVCGGDTSTIKVELNGESPFELTWSDGVIQQSSSSVITRVIQPDRPSLYVLQKAKDKNGPGPIYPNSLMVQVEPRPVAPVITGYRGVESGDPLTLTANGTFVSYQWYLNGNPIPGAVNRTYHVGAAEPADTGHYTVTGRYSQCHSLQSFGVDLEVASRRIVPVLGQTDGAFGASFRSSIQIANPNDASAEGTIDAYGFEPSAPRQTAFTVPAHGAVAFTDMAPILGQAALGSADVSVAAGSRLPDSVVRIYNDAGSLGTTGVNVPQVRLSEVLQPGDAAVLIGPANPASFRFNVGIRTLGHGVTMNVRNYGSDGQLRMLVQRSYPEDSFRQMPAGDLLGIPMTPSGTLRFEIVSGTAVIYGTTIENRTNDPIIQLAERVHSEAQPVQMVLPVASSVLGAYGSWFKTGVQIHNPGSTPINVTLGFRPALQIAGKASNERLYRVDPYSTVAIDDLLPALGTKGYGSIDVTSNGTSRPVLLARVFNDGIEGQTGTNESALAFPDVPRAGDRVVLIAPPTPDTLRFNLGVRTLGEGATIDFYVRSASGALRHSSRREYPTSYLIQQPAAEFFGFELGANDWIEVKIVQGAAVVYGSSTDNVTQDPSLQLSGRVGS